jgi:RNA polymerase-binding transcription factor DksA
MKIVGRPLSEVIELITNANLQSVDNCFLRNGAVVWERLHSEREDVCAELLGASRPIVEPATAISEIEPADESVRDVEWNDRELLQARLRRLDDALDRLMAGAYGRCSECNKPIDEKRLAANPAVSYCVSCQHRSEGEQHFRTM